MNRHNTRKPTDILCIGTWSMGGEHFGPYDTRQATQTLNLAYNNGIRSFDTAQFYAHGQSLRLLNSTFKTRRHTIKISAKGGIEWDKNKVIKNSSPDKLRETLETTLHMLNTDYLDIYSLHWPDKKTPLTTSLSTLEQFKKEGLIKTWGICNLTTEELKTLPIDLTGIPHQIHHSLLHDQSQLLKESKNRGMTTFITSPLEQGLLSNKNEIKEYTLSKKDHRNKNPYFNNKRVNEKINAIAKVAKDLNHTMVEYTLKQYSENPLIDRIIIGPRTPEQVNEIMHSFN